MMLSVYKQICEQICVHHKENSTKIIEMYFKKIFDFYDKNDRLAIIEILDKLFCYKEDEMNKKEYADIYELYGTRKFMVSEFNQEELEHIKNRYMEGLRNLGKEYGCAF